MAQPPKGPKSGKLPFAGTAGGKRYYRNTEGKLVDEAGEIQSGGYAKFLESQFGPAETPKVEPTPQVAAKPAAPTRRPTTPPSPPEKEQETEGFTTADAALGLGKFTYRTGKFLTKEILATTFPDIYKLGERYRQALSDNQKDKEQKEKEAQQYKRDNVEIGGRLQNVAAEIKNNGLLIREQINLQTKSIATLDNISKTLNSIERKIGSGGGFGEGGVTDIIKSILPSMTTLLTALPYVLAITGAAVGLYGLNRENKKFYEESGIDLDKARSGEQSQEEIEEKVRSSRRQRKEEGFRREGEVSTPGSREAILRPRLLIEDIMTGKMDSELGIDSSLSEDEKNKIREKAATEVAQSKSWEDIVKERKLQPNYKASALAGGAALAAAGIAVSGKPDIVAGGNKGIAGGALGAAGLAGESAAIQEAKGKKPGEKIIQAEADEIIFNAKNLKFEVGRLTLDVQEIQTEQVGAGSADTGVAGPFGNMGPGGPGAGSGGSQPEFKPDVMTPESKNIPGIGNIPGGKGAYKMGGAVIGPTPETLATEGVGIPGQPYSFKPSKEGIETINALVKEESEFKQITSGGLKQFSYGSKNFTGSNKEWYQRMYTTLYNEAVKAGLKNPEVVAALGAAQSSVESGYGKDLRGSMRGNNAFGIKHFGVPGTAGTSGPYKAFNNVEESAREYIQFIQRNKRYSGVLASKTIEEAAQAIGRSGYAEDPAYGSKVLGAMRIGGGIPSQKELTPYQKLPDAKELKVQPKTDGIPGLPSSLFDREKGIGSISKGFETYKQESAAEIKDPLTKYFAPNNLENIPEPLSRGFNPASLSGITPNTPELLMPRDTSSIMDDINPFGTFDEDYGSPSGEGNEIDTTKAPETPRSQPHEYYDHLKLPTLKDQSISITVV